VRVGTRVCLMYELQRFVLVRGPHGQGRIAAAAANSQATMYTSKTFYLFCMYLMANIVVGLRLGTLACGLLRL
jgi:hypothetical protein